MNVNSVALLIDQIVQMLSSVEKFINELLLILVLDWETKASFDSRLVILLDHLWPEDSSVCHVCASLHVEYRSDSCFLESKNIIKTEWISSNNDF